MEEERLIRLLKRFVGSFEIVFHYDWNYTKTMIGDEAKGQTFIRPGLEDENEDWGARGQLLEDYRTLKTQLARLNLDVEISEIWRKHIGEQERI